MSKIPDFDDLPKVKDMPQGQYQSTKRPYQHQTI